MDSGPAWTTFAALAALVTAALLVLAHFSEVTVEEDGTDAVDRSPLEPDAASDVRPGTLLVNVALSQGLLASLLAFGAWYARIPAAALGLDRIGGVAIALGVALGVALYAADEALALAADRVGAGHAEELRELLTPDSVRGWAILLGGVLPLIAGFEELLFRGVLVGAFAAGFGVSPWLLAIGSSVLFGLAHGAQGPGGVIVTGVLGFSLAAAFVVTGSLLVVIVAHYLVNALEFGVHEGLDVEWRA